jgi:hypothetical protein
MIHHFQNNNLVILGPFWLELADTQDEFLLNLIFNLWRDRWHFTNSMVAYLFVADCTSTGFTSTPSISARKSCSTSLVPFCLDSDTVALYESLAARMCWYRGWHLSKSSYNLFSACFLRFFLSLGFLFRFMFIIQAISFLHAFTSLNCAFYPIPFIL